MDTFIDSIIEFVRVRQLNLALAGILTLVYLLYQYWGTIYKCQDDDDYRQTPRLSRSPSRSCSRSRSRSDEHYYKSADVKHGRRSRKTYRRCPDCSMCQ